MGANDFLIFRAPEVRRQMIELTQGLENDKSLKEFFMRDPAGVIKRKLFADETIPSAEINRGNRLLYSLLSNKGFIEWSKSYQKELIKDATESTNIEDPTEALNAYLAITDRSRIHADLAAAVAEFADKEIIASLTWRPDARSARIGTREPVKADVAVDIETFIYAVAVAAAFVVVVVALGLAARPNEQFINRLDVRNAVNQMTAELARRGNELRSEGKLTQFSQRNTGFTR